MSRILPNINLKAFFALGEDNWNNDVDANFLKVSTLCQAVSLGIIDTKPINPIEGSVYICSNIENTNPLSIATFSGGQWNHFSPKIGWMVYDISQEEFLYFNGSNWITSSVTSEKLKSISQLDNTNGIIYQNSPDGYTKKIIGSVNNTDILDKQSASTLYSALNHTHTDLVQSFNNREGEITLTSDDVSNALTYIPQEKNTRLDGLSDISTSLGLVEQIGDNTFSKRPIGLSNENNILTKSMSDARYQPISTSLSGISNIVSSYGVIVKLSSTEFETRNIDQADSNSLVSKGFSDNRYVRSGTGTITQLADFPGSMSGSQGKYLRVNDLGNALVFSNAVTPVIRSYIASHTINDNDANAVVEMNNGTTATLTVPDNTMYEIPIGSFIEIHQIGTALVTVAPDVGVTVQSKGSLYSTSGQFSVITLRKVAQNIWRLYGDLS